MSIYDKPATFPPRSAEDAEAIKTFQYVLRKYKKIRSELNDLDCFPNTDGNIFLTDENNYPVGTLDVQIKGSVGLQGQYSKFSRHYVGYSNTISLPFIFVCVDRDDESIYWRHIHSQIEEYVKIKDKLKRKTFTLYFDNKIHLIDPKNLDHTYDQWLELTKEYLYRVKHFGETSKKVLSLSEQLDCLNLDSANEHQITYYQQVSDGANQLLDNGFQGIKHYFFPGMFKLGLAFAPGLSANLNCALFQVNYGEPAILLRLLKSKHAENDSILIHDDPMYFSRRIHVGDEQKEPEEYGQDIVLDIVKKIISNRDLPLDDTEFDKEQIFYFIDNYGDCIGIEPKKSSYSLDELNSVHLSGLIEFMNAFPKHPDIFICPCKILNSRIKKKFKENSNLNLREFFELLHSGKAEFAKQANKATPLYVNDQNGILHRLAHSYNRLRKALIGEIHRDDKSIHSLTSPTTIDELHTKLTAILEYAIQYYTKLVKIYGMRISDSLCANNEWTLRLVLSHFEESIVQTNIYIEKIKNLHGELPKLIIEIADAMPEITVHNYSFRGKEYERKTESKLYKNRIINYILSNNTPLFNAVYMFLEYDLSKQYQLFNSPNFL